MWRPLVGSERPPVSRQTLTLVLCFVLHYFMFSACEILMTSKPNHVSFLLVPGFMMSAFVLALDALRLANWRAGKTLYEWDIRTVDNLPASANNEMRISPDLGLNDGPMPQAVFVAAGFSAERGCTKTALGWLRRLDRNGAVLGGWDTGALLLAEAGLMANRRMAVHWQAARSIQERYLNVAVSTNRCEIDERRLTGPGGLSSFDLMLSYIQQTAGGSIAQMVAESANRDVESTGLENRLSKSRAPQRDPVVAKALRLMDENIETPLTIPNIASQCGINERQFGRLFLQALGSVPRTYYLSLRLDRANQLLRQTRLSVTEIALMTGFNSLSRFSQAYKSHFGHAPLKTQRVPPWLDLDARPNTSRGLISTREDEPI